LLGATANRGLYLLLSIFAARMLGKDAFGQFSLIQTTIGMFALLAGFGLGLACSKHVAELRQHEPARAGQLIVLSAIWTTFTGGVGSLALFLGAPWLAQHTSPAPALACLFRTSSPMILFGSINGALTGILTGFESFKTVAGLNLVCGLMMLGFLVAGIQVAGIQGAVWGVTISLALTSLLSLIAVRRETARWRVPLATSGWMQELPVLWRFCLPILLATVLVTPVYWFAQAVLTSHFGFAAQAEYTIGAQWRTAVSWLPAMLTSAYLPVLSSLCAASETIPSEISDCARSELRRDSTLSPSDGERVWVRGTCARIAEKAKVRRSLIYSGLGASGALALAGALLIALAAELILRAYGPAFRECVWVLRILAAAAVFDSLNDLINQTFLASGHAWFRLWANSLWAVLTVCGILVVVPKTGTLGLATVLLVTQGLHLGFQLLLYRSAAANAP
jgi:O-antigen/teichoic acid export membrane protein